MRSPLAPLDAQENSQDLKTIIENVLDARLDKYQCGLENVRKLLEEDRQRTDQKTDRMLHALSEFKDHLTSVCSQLTQLQRDVTEMQTKVAQANAAASDAQQQLLAVNNKVAVLKSAIGTSAGGLVKDVTMLQKEVQELRQQQQQRPLPGVAEEYPRATLRQREQFLYISNVPGDGSVAALGAALAAAGVSPLPHFTVLHAHAPTANAAVRNMTIHVPAGSRDILVKAQQLRAKGYPVMVDMTKAERDRRKAVWQLPGFRAAHEAAVRRRRQQGPQSVRLQWQLDRCIIGHDVWAADYAPPAPTAQAGAA